MQLHSLHSTEHYASTLTLELDDLVVEGLAHHVGALAVLLQPRELPAHVLVLLFRWGFDRK